MGVNGYQGQICAIDQPNGYFSANQEIFTLIQNLSSVSVDYLERIGVQAPEGTMISINGILIQIGKTGLYEIDNVEVTSIKFLENNSPQSVIIDYIIHRSE